MFEYEIDGESIIVRARTEEQIDAAVRLAEHAVELHATATMVRRGGQKCRILPMNSEDVHTLDDVFSAAMNLFL
jgi:hypothetical protein